MDTRSITIPPAVSQHLGELLADRNAVINVLEQLRNNLQEQPANYRKNRDDEDPNFLFSVPIRLPLRGRWRVVRFLVNDTISPDHFFVEAVSMSD